MRLITYQELLKEETISKLKSLILAATNQTILHSEEEGIRGNCFPACIAAITGKKIDEVPQFQEMEDEEWGQAFIEYIQSIGWEFHGCPQFQDLGEGDWEEFPFMIVGGDSPRGISCGHAVIYYNRNPFWDPHPSGEFILAEKEVYLIKPVSGW